MLRRLCVVAAVTISSYLGVVSRSADLLPTVNAFTPRPSLSARGAPASPSAQFASPTLVSSTYIGSSYSNAVIGATADGHGNYIVTGYGDLTGTGLPITASIGPGGGGGSFVAKFAADGAPEFVTYVGRAGSDFVGDVAVDGAGHVYVLGLATSEDFPVVAPPAGSSSHADSQTFVARLADDGASFVYCAFVATLTSQGQGLAVDSFGGAYVTGTTTSEDFPLVSPLQPVFGGLQDAFVLKVAADGSRIEYSTYLGGQGEDTAQGIAVDVLGQAYVAGWTRDKTGFPVVQPVASPPSESRDDAFLTVVTSDGSAILSSTLLGGPLYDRAFDVVARDGRAIVTGVAADGFPTRRALRNSTEDSEDGFVTAINVEGSAVSLDFSTFVGGKGADAGNRIALAPDGSIVIGGYTHSTNLALVNPIQSTRRCDPRFTTCPDEIFLAAISPSGNTLTFQTYLGGARSDLLEGLAADSFGRVVVGGITESRDFPTRHALQRNFGRVQWEGFLVQISPVQPPDVRAATPIERSGKPFRVRIDGSNFQPGAVVFLDNDDEAWPNFKHSTPTQIVLKGGSTLSDRFPEGRDVVIRVENINGGVGFARVRR